MHDADGRVDRQRDAVHQRVGHADRLDGERPDARTSPRSDLDQLGFVEQLVLFELAFDVGQRELGAVDGHVQLAQNPGQAADVVLVPVRQDDRRGPCALFSIR